jgi:N6-adenosine-specific RNA methylase IME4
VQQLGKVFGKSLGTPAPSARPRASCDGARATLLRSVSEPFLIATLPGSGFRGSREVNLMDGLARERSRKPDEAYALIERIMPGKRYADVFSRQRSEHEI